MLTWRTSDDPCPRCLALNGKRDGDGWSSTPYDDQVGPPPLHPNCRCYIVDEAEPQLEAFLRSIT